MCIIILKSSDNNCCTMSADCLPPEDSSNDSTFIETEFTGVRPTRKWKSIDVASKGLCMDNPDTRFRRYDRIIMRRESGCVPW
jgi:hypothetical protein